MDEWGGWSTDSRGLQLEFLAAYGFHAQLRVDNMSLPEISHLKLYFVPLHLFFLLTRSHQVALTSQKLIMRLGLTFSYYKTPEC